MISLESRISRPRRGDHRLSSAAGRYVTDHPRQFVHGERVEVRLLPEHGLPVQHQRIPDLRGGNEGGIVTHGHSPLWVWMHGGGVGYFDTSGTPRPDGTQMTENSASSLQASLTNAGLSANIQADPAGFRMLAVSYCSRDIYSGTGQTDPNNPNKNADGSARTTNGLQATKAAVAFTEATYPTSKYFLAGGSAGSAGAYYVAWSRTALGQSASRGGR